MCFYRARSCPDFVITLDNKQLPITKSVVDLGVTLDTGLTFTAHYSLIVNRAAKTLGFVMRNLQPFNIHVIKLVYCSLVRSLMEYCAILWSPYYQVHIRSLEKVQNRFLRYCGFRMGMQEYTYDQVMRALDLKTLEVRRRDACLNFWFKLISGEVDSAYLLGRVCLNVCPYRNRHTELFYVGFHSTNHSLNSPIGRLHRVANEFSDVLDFFSPGAHSFRQSVRCLE